MAVYTHVDADEVTALLSHYDVGTLSSLIGIEQGVENTNYFLNTDKGHFILTLFEKRVDPADLPFFLGLMHHLAQSQIPCPMPVARRDGAFVSTIKERCAALTTFLEGTMIARITPAACAEIGKALARMHVAGQGFPLTRPNTMGLPAWKDLFEKTRAQADDVKGGLCDILTKEMAFLSQSWPTDLPRGLIHADLFPDNVFFKGEGLCGLIDFYFSCTDFLAYDLVICMNAWCFEHNVSFNITKARALIEGYERIRPLTAEEKWRLPTLARGASMRFLLSRLYDGLNQVPGALVKAKDPTDYLSRLVFHQQVPSFTAYGLDP